MSLSLARVTSPGAPRFATILQVSLVAVFAALVIAYASVGYIDSDDTGYAQAARGWVREFPHVASHHWGLRHVIVLPMAMMFRLFGDNEITLVTPMVLSLAALMTLYFLCVRRVAGLNAGLLAALLVALVPMFVLNATTVTTDLPEAALIVASVWTFHFAWQDKRTGLFILAGVLAGLGFITRETSIALVLLYGLLFIVNYGGSRLPYIWMGVGFALVIGADTALLAWGSGDPLHRLHVSAQGVERDNPSMADQFETEAGVDRFGSLAAPRWLSAILVLFANQNMGLIYWAAVPAAAVLVFMRGKAPAGAAARLFAGLALVWFLLTSFVFYFLWILPRYQSVTTAAVIVPLAIVLGPLIDSGRWRLPAAVIIALAGVELLIISATDRNPLYGERALIAYLRQHDGTVLTDPGTAKGAEWFLEREGLTERVVAAPPQPGATYFYNERPRRRPPADWLNGAQRQDWTQIASFDRMPGPLARLVDQLGLRRYLPGVIARKLNPTPQVVRVYRVPE